MAGLEKNMRQKNQAKAQVEQKLKEVKDVVKECPHFCKANRYFCFSGSLEGNFTFN